MNTVVWILFLVWTDNLDESAQAVLTTEQLCEQWAAYLNRNEDRHVRTYVCLKRELWSSPP